MRRRDRRESVASPRRARSDAPWWEVAAVLIQAVAVVVAVVAAVVALREANATRRANTEELALFRQQLGLSQKQFDTSTRPIVVPVADFEEPLVDTETNKVRFRLQNVTDAPALGGFVVIAPTGTADPIDRPRPYPTCGDADEALGHEAVSAIPPIPAGETVQLEFDVPFDAVSQAVICGTVDYIDATREHRLTDWTWNRGYVPYLSAGLEPFIPSDIQLIDGPPPTWWFAQDLD